MFNILGNGAWSFVVLILERVELEYGDETRSAEAQIGHGDLRPRQGLHPT